MAPRRPLPILLLFAFLWMPLAAAAQVNDLPVELSAREMIYEQELGVVTARGDVEILQGERVLFADTVTYNERDEVVTASGNVVLREPSGDVLFADYVELTDNFKQGVVEELKIRLANRARMAARRARREGENRTILERVVYTRCEECPEHPDRPPIWQIKANRVTRDLDKEIVEYQNARLEMFGVPVFYAPYFYHPDPTVERKSGLLAPIVGSSTELGFQYSQPVYLVLDEDKDMTLTPRFLTKELPVLGAEYRQQFDAGRWDTDVSLTYVDEVVGRTQTGDKEFRGHFRSKGDFRIDEGADWGFNLFRASDDTYLRIYDIGGGNTLTSTAYVTDYDGRRFRGLEFFSFQGLQENDDDGATPLVMPLATWQDTFSPGVLGGRVDYTFGGVALQRTSGRDTRRLSFDGSWERQAVDPFGGLTTFGMHFRADGYMVSEAQDTDPTASENDYYEGRIWPQATLDWRLPLVRPANGHFQKIEPVVQLIGSPAGANPNDIPNEDSLSFEFSDANLFDRNRFVGFDRVESGSRVNYGVRMGVYGDGGGESEFLIGQSFRFNETSAFGPGTGLDDRLSDVVGRLLIAPTDSIDYTFRFRVDMKGPDLDRHEHRLSLRDDWYSFSLGYISVPRVGGAVAVGNTQELTTEGTLNFAENWQVLGAYRGDLDRGVPIRFEGGLRYEDECFDFQLGVVRDFTSDRDLEASTSVFVRISLTGLN
ncbi:LPS-assembly protein LptD [Minwuia thermotolerans]|uniref:LPS-assembly protein LptD n=1 Tax=Minwuia thermotolerans TaxID=2056226 RepID=A0A2M9FZH2_9PROT|nr:LPS assembly protein LptD [Minwuia thermotolerans]PJK28855.1 LPS-assembly protein LptD [Minwuia thermotolerans]